MRGYDHLKEDGLLITHHYYYAPDCEKVTVHGSAKDMQKFIVQPTPVTIMGVSRYYYVPRHNCGEYVMNLFDILYVYKHTIPLSEDWYINLYDDDKPLYSDVRNRKHYQKITVLTMLQQLYEHGVLCDYRKKDIIKNNFEGEQYSYFRPYYPVHVCMDIKGKKFIPKLYQNTGELP